MGLMVIVQEVTLFYKPYWAAKQRKPILPSCAWESSGEGREAIL